jgi:hypothetical protein
MQELLSIDLLCHIKNYSGSVYRVVNADYDISTRQLVDNTQEQFILDNLILDKPRKLEEKNLHPLLSKPFRKPPLKDGQRFHRKHETSIFYGAKNLKTALTEIAYHIFRLIRKSDAQLSAISPSYMCFMVSVETSKAIRLTENPFNDYRAEISHPSSYRISQELGSLIRQTGVELFDYYSARDRNGINLGIFTPNVFPDIPIIDRDGYWSVYITSEIVEFKNRNINQPTIHSFKLQDFFIDGKFPLIAE